MGLSDHSLAGRTAGKALGVQIGSGCGGVKAGLVCRGWWVGGQGLPVAKVGGQRWRVAKVCRWVAKVCRWLANIGGRVAKVGRWLANIGGWSRAAKVGLWVAKVGRWLAKQGLPGGCGQGWPVGGQGWLVVGQGWSVVGWPRGHAAGEMLCESFLLFLHDRTYLYM